ncbi:hypothetical protein BS50DRAFT_628562 [Corynespora cassiicola Philippines]|uniref:ATP-dependent DNA ligase family profile domain-containing protein n=1 Tax=Corynespora cassiicola Philippines TaxID=1448308 RepID=A0A2T2PCV1_CORCC|nr:hypothetical protein BS50DRAFT_628562 [Corynespora cassiicola Philippines]
MTISFSDICDLLESVEKIMARKRRLPSTEEKEAIQQAVSKWFTAYRQDLDRPDTDGAAILSAILPHMRKDRVYGLQVESLAKKIAKVLNFSASQRVVMDKFKTSEVGDLGTSVQRIMRHFDGTFRKKPPTSIEQVDRFLVQLAAKTRFSDPAIKDKREEDLDIDEEFRKLLIRLESREIKWLVRLVLRAYPTVELDESFVCSQYHFLLPELLLFQDDFDAVFSVLRGGLRSYPSRPGPAAEVALRIEAAKQLVPSVGVKVGRPTFRKAWSFKNCLQMVGNRAWAAETKYDGEYCEIHVNLEDSRNSIQIFSKNGKDATADRQALHSTIRDALRIGCDDCIFKQKCILLGEMVLWNDKEQAILPFSKIRKHISRSGSFIGTLEDSLPHEWEHLMIVFFDILLMDKQPIMRQCLQDRRAVLRDLVRVIPGRSIRSEWTLLDFKSDTGVTDLKQAFARTLAYQQEGLVLKPLHSPYFPLITDIRNGQPGYFIKMKKDYLSDMGGERDLGDFAIIGACYDPQTAPKTDLRPLHWTHFHIACLTNKQDVDRKNAKSHYKVVGCLSLDKCISKVDLKYLNRNGYLVHVPIGKDNSINRFDFEQPNNYGPRMKVVFKRPFIGEILGGGYEQVQNEAFEMLRHPRLKKIHNDRTLEDAITMQELEEMAADKWEVPDPDELDGHVKDVALLAKKYIKEMRGSSEYATTQETSTTQLTTPSNTQESPSSYHTPPDVVVNEMQQRVSQVTHTTLSTQNSSSTQADGLRVSREFLALVPQDTSERADNSRPVEPVQPGLIPLPTPPGSAPGAPSTAFASKKRKQEDDIISPPASKRRRMRDPLKSRTTNAELGSFDHDSEEKVLYIYPQVGWRVVVHEEAEEELR